MFVSGLDYRTRDLHPDLRLTSPPALVRQSRGDQRGLVDLSLRNTRLLPRREVQEQTSMVQSALK